MRASVRARRPFRLHRSGGTRHLGARARLSSKQRPGPPWPEQEPAAEDPARDVTGAPSEAGDNDATATANDAGSRPLRVAIVDDEPTVRTLVRMLIDRSGRFELVAEADHVTPGIELAASTQPDVVLLDLLLPGTGGATSLPDIAAAAPQAMILVLSALRGDDEAEAAFRAGAFAYLEKSLLGPALLGEVADLYELFLEQRDGRDVWAEPGGPPRTRR